MPEIQSAVAPHAARTGRETGCIHFFGKGLPGVGVPSIEALGGKGVNLFKLVHAGFPVPAGLVITTAAYRQFVTHNELQDRIAGIISSLKPHDPARIEAASVHIRDLFEKYEIPESLSHQVLEAYARLQEYDGGKRLSVAVRSSATAEDLEEAAFAGQQDTFLNVQGDQALLKAVKACWSSLWTARAITYRAHHGFDTDGLALAVVVQKMVLSDASGVMFSVNPVTGARDEIIVNAAWGLGEAIVGGQVTPDMLVVEKKTWRIKEVTVSEKTVMTAHTADGTVERELTDHRRHARVLDDRQAGTLAQIGSAVEAHYGTPQDIEWCLAGGEFFLVQSRPVTALPPEPVKPEELERVRQEEIGRLKELAGKNKKVWVIHNLAETLPAPQPLTWDIMARFMSGNGGYGLMYRDFGYHPSRRVCEEGFLELICGRIYVDPDRAPEQFWEGLPVKYDLDEVLSNPAVLECAPKTFDASRADERFLLRLPGTLCGMLRSHFKMKRARKEAVEAFDRRVLPAFRAYLDEKNSQDLKALPITDLVREIHDRIQRVMDEFGKESLKPGYFGGIALAELKAQLAQIMDETEGERLTQVLTSGLDGNTTLEQNALQYKVGKGQVRLEDFLALYGHRAVGEMELANPRYREDRSFFKQISRTQSAGESHTPEEMHRKNAEKREAAMNSLRELLAPWGGSSFYEEIRDLAMEAQKLLPYREAGKHYLMTGYELIRLALLEIGRRFEIGDDVFFLHLNELSRFEDDSEKFKAEIVCRKLRWKIAQRLDVPDVIDSSTLDALGLPRKFEQAGELKAVPLSAGSFEGTARILRNPGEAGNLGSECILVCSSTDPSWTALFTVIKGLIVERGGALSHGAITARDFGIPAVACPDATSLIKDGARIRVDADRGQITIIEDSSHA
jgi:pyruvate,water dikinase